MWAPLLLRLCLPGQMQHHYTTSCVVLLGCIAVFIANSKNFLMLAIRAGWCTSTWGCWVPLLKGRSDCCQSRGLKICEPSLALWPHLPAVLFQYRSKASCLYNLGRKYRGWCTSSFTVYSNRFSLYLIRRFIRGKTDSKQNNLKFMFSFCFTFFSTFSHYQV